MRAPLVAGGGVDLVDDHRLDRAQHRPAPGGGDQQIERLGGGDQEVGRAADHRRPLAGRGVAGPDRRPSDAGRRVARARRRPRRSPAAAGRGSRRCRRPAPSAATRRPPGRALDRRRRRRGPGRAGRCRPGSRPASCPTRWGRRSACRGPAAMWTHPVLLGRRRPFREPPGEPLGHRRVEPDPRAAQGRPAPDVNNVGSGNDSHHLREYRPGTTTRPRATRVISHALDPRNGHRARPLSRARPPRGDADRLLGAARPSVPARTAGPGRGLRPGGADGRALADLHVEVGTGVWRFVPRGGKDEQRAHDALITTSTPWKKRDGVLGGAQDPDRRTMVPGFHRGAGPGEKALADPGAVRDIAGALAEGLTRHMADVRRRLSGVTGSWSRSTSRSCRRCWPESCPRPAAGAGSELRSGGRGGRAPPGAGRCPLRRRTGADRGRTATAGRGSPRRVDRRRRARSGPLREAGAGFLGIDGAVLDSVDEDEVGQAIDAGLGLLVACVPLDHTAERSPTGARPPSATSGNASASRSTCSPKRWRSPRSGARSRSTVSDVPDVLRRTVEAARYLDESAAEEES